MAGVFLRDLTWLEAEKTLGPETVVVVPIGAAAKEHGPHLRLDNDERLADGYARLVAEVADVVVAPTLSYHFYPAFVEYPGSTTLRLETARDMTVDVVRSIARHGPRRFYALNTGVSTVRALAPAAELLAREGILFRYTNVLEALAPVEREVSKQEGGTHADELETSIMLVLAPDRVDMTKAVRDYTPDRGGGLTRDPAGEGTYSPTGTWGDPTLATREKGRKLVEAFVDAVLSELDALRAAPV
ncbi:MAG: creatininase family protein [Labilithrix sp.]|nr:creatininase family protein [Labilithrix sp.]